MLGRGVPRVRGIELARAGWGAALLISPRAVLTRVNRVEVDHRSLLVARILGARQLGQAVLSGLDPSSQVLALGVWVDLVHAGTAVALAAVDRPRARAGLTDALIALGWAGFGFRDLSSGATRPARFQRRRDAAAGWLLDQLPGARPLQRTVAGRATPAPDRTGGSGRLGGCTVS